MDLSVQTRNKLGKAAKSLRKQGLIPAELYGRGTANLHLAVPSGDFARVFKEAGTNTVVNLLLDPEEHPASGRSAETRSKLQSKVPAIIHEIGRNYISGKVDHIDFYQVRMDEKIKAKIPVEFLGASPAVKDKGGILNRSVSEIEVEALPADLPHRFEVDLSALSELNQSIYVKDISVPKGARILVDPETPVVTVTEPRPEEVVEAAPADISAVKVETEEKKAERGSEKTTAEVSEKKEAS